MDFAGEVEAVGAGVGSFQPGERVFGLTPDGHGGHAQYLIVPEKGAIAPMPAGVPFDEAVVCEGALYADTDLRGLGLAPGHSILIYGGSGAIGSAAVQLAKAYGAEVTAVVATQHLELVKSLGADRVIDYTVGDFTTTGETFDFVFDAVGKTVVLSRPQVAQARRALHGDRFRASQPEPARHSLVCDHQEQAVRVSDSQEHEGVRRAARGVDGGGGVPCRHRPEVSSRGDRRGLPLCRDEAEDGHRGIVVIDVPIPEYHDG